MRPLATLLAASLGCLALAAPVPKAKDTGLFNEPGWDKPIDPDNDCKFTKGADGLSIEVPAKDHDIDPRRKRHNAPRYVRDFEGDFRMEVRVRGKFHASEKARDDGAMLYSAGGLFVGLGDKGGSVRFEFGAIRRHSLTDGQELNHVFLKTAGVAGQGVGGTIRLSGGKGWPLKAEEAYLRLDRAGDRFTASYSPDGEKWTVLSSTTPKAPVKIKVGVVALNTSDGALKVTFDRFKLSKGKPAAKAGNK